MVDGVPHMVYPETLSTVEQHTQSEYDRVAERVYDVAMDWQFAAFLENLGYDYVEESGNIAYRMFLGR